MRYVTRHGLADLSLRPLARAVGSSPRVLLYYFGSKEKIVMSVLAEIRKQQLTSYGDVTADTMGEVSRIIWQRMIAEESEKTFRLFFEAYGMALRRPKLYRSFLRSTVEVWLQLIATGVEAEGLGRAEALAFATVMLAGFRGFMLDYCNTRDRKRLDRAVDLWARSLDTMLVEGKKSSWPR